jgi:hypothetical protein
VATPEDIMQEGTIVAAYNSGELPGPEAREALDSIYIEPEQVAPEVLDTRPEPVNELPDGTGIDVPTEEAPGASNEMDIEPEDPVDLIASQPTPEAVVHDFTGVLNMTQEESLQLGKI